MGGVKRNVHQLAMPQMLTPQANKDTWGTKQTFIECLLGVSQ